MQENELSKKTLEGIKEAKEDIRKGRVYTTEQLKEELFKNKNLQRHFCATTYIVENEKILMLWHKKFNSWMPPGGHCEKNELPHEAAQREILEETGLNVDFLVLDFGHSAHKDFLRENDRIAQVNPVPWQVLLEKIAENHFHMDFVFIARPNGKKSLALESHELKWFSKKELEAETRIIPNVKYFGLKALNIIEGKK